MTVAYWQPGTVYAVGDLVQSIRSSNVVQDPLYNGDFEGGDTGWTKAANAAIVASGAYEGTYALRQQCQSATVYRTINEQISQVTPGTIVQVECKVKTPNAAQLAAPMLVWYDASFNILSYTTGSVSATTSTEWRSAALSAPAPENAAYVAAAAYVSCSFADSSYVYFDNFSWSQAYRDLTPYGVIFRATVGGYSGSSEPTWPTAVSGTVVDNEVTWTAVEANRIIWRARSLAKSGSSEPNWPTGYDGVVGDGNFQWTLASQQIKDVNCPNTKTVAIASSKVFVGDNDIVAFCATNNALDWTTQFDAGFIPFGLNTYGAQPVSALGLYRSNLVIFNNKAFQMWQVDPDPANFAILDAVPVGCGYYKSLQGVNNDLIFLTSKGIRNMGIAGASINLQAGFFGKQIDPLVKAALKLMDDTDDIVSLYHPGEGQYWLLFDNGTFSTAYVLTMNGDSSDMSWSQYAFPLSHSITDWTILDDELYLRTSGNEVWRLDSDAVRDGMTDIEDLDTGNAINTHLWWHYLDFGALGVTKQMIGFDLVVSGETTVTFGYDQTDANKSTTGYVITGDTIPGDIIPMPLSAPSIQMRLTSVDQAWEWNAAAIHVQDFRATS